MTLEIKEPNTNPIQATDFFTELSTYYTLIGNGLFLKSELETVTAKLVSYFGKVNIASKSQLLSLEAIAGGLTGYQMACVSEFAVIQQKLADFTSNSNLDIEFEEYTIK